jgi:hypothetical protein
MFFNSGWPSQNGWVAQRQDAASFVTNLKQSVQNHRVLRMNHPVPAAHSHTGCATL